ncbi:MAG: tripartite tricarboxylate transporter permease [Alphaproteobacteria bacterium]
MSELALQAILAVVQPDLLLLLAGSVIVGIVAGCLPGISATMGVAVVSPLTFTMDPFSGIVALLGIYTGAVYGGSISAILLGIPGTPGAVATVLDGYTLGRKGFAGRALGVATISSFIGGVFATVALALLAYPIATFALSFGPREYLALAFFALTAVATLSGGSALRGGISALIGMFMATIGIDEMYGSSRFHFGEMALFAGIPFIPAIIGLFAVPETLVNIERISSRRRRSLAVDRVLPGFTLLRSLLPAQFRSAGIGTIVGAVPGTGSDIAAIVAYSQGRNFSRQPERFGTGCEEGIACPEAGNNAAVGGTMIPLLTLGIPGGAVTAIILGAFMTHGLRPGPLLLQNDADLVYKIFAGLFVANLMLLAFGLAGARLFARVIRVRDAILAPIVLMLCIVGSFALNNSVYDVLIMASAGMLGYAMVKTDIPRAPLVIGLIIGPMVERELTRTLLVVGDDWASLFTPISAVIWVLALLPFVWPLFRRSLAGRFGIRARGAAPDGGR